MIGSVCEREAKASMSAVSSASVIRGHRQATPRSSRSLGGIAATGIAFEVPDRTHGAARG
jgi:hypothetical protein